MDDQAHAHLPVSVGDPGRVTMMGGGELIFSFVLDPPALTLIVVIVLYSVWGFIDQALWLMI